MTTYNNTTTATTSSGWIFGKFDPGAEYRSKPGDENTVQRRKKINYVRYRIHSGAINFVNQEGTIAVSNTLSSTNGTGASGAPLGSANMILSDHVLDNEAGQGSAIWRETESWEAFSNWVDWTTITADLGVTDPFS